MEKTDSLNESTDAEDALDEDRINDIKTLIYRAYKMPNREGMRTKNLIKHLNELYPDTLINRGVTREDVKDKSELPHLSLYNTLLNV